MFKVFAHIESGKNLNCGIHYYSELKIHIYCAFVMPDVMWDELLLENFRKFLYEATTKIIPKFISFYCL